jgi:hypothetical protein
MHNRSTSLILSFCKERRPTTCTLAVCLVDGWRSAVVSVAELGPLPGCLSPGRGLFGEAPTAPESEFVRLSPVSKKWRQLQQIPFAARLRDFSGSSSSLLHQAYTTALALLRHIPPILAFAVHYCIPYQSFKCHSASVYS